MKTKTLEITTAIGCSVSCPYCPQSLLVSRYHGPSEMSVADFATCIDKVPGDVRVHFSGMAEPWMNPRCTEMVYYAASRHDIQVYTTTCGMSRRDAESLAKLKFDKFSIHVPDNAPGCRIPFKPEIIEILWPIITEFISVGPPRLDVQAAVRQVVASKCNSRAGHITPTAARSGKLSCPWGDFQQNVLLPNGDVVLCCMDFGLEHCLGNLLVDSYSDLHCSLGYTQLRDALNTPSEPALCRMCDNAKYHSA